MFTGLVEDVGKVKNIKISSKGGTLEVITSLKEIKVGDSIAVNGVCLTVTKVEDSIISFDLSPETLRRSNLSKAFVGDLVNLERAIKVGDRLGGHILLGHVDFTSRIESFRSVGDHYELKIYIPDEWILYFVEKGSVGIDGISLTVNTVEGNLISLNIIPHTYQNTNLKGRKEGDHVNIEVDILGKYVINYLSKRRERRLDQLLERLF
ncbi:riboflavin synthase, alpha subunit [Hydrogenobacter thermophilus TK-6]|uniref:Riboflavin synthase n=1 Tax=Hydrogenobacter thermophilus (strain DSM 6534 / IAM 12695 / TK-6) TaxID=608538 RepID=D3DG83_HYDTT|nr:riboflavin synthase [Hydrogenobacter thermophilus]ADO44770.1 riboflavin synthase, alpha subunit [Hydrogenobacter thermophilus TK-6]BAI68835.1 riboflavin synthase alpha chain [Hydrogenobacter thermophilus TK-6]